jgi:cytochrome c oxidase subunit II
MGRLSRRVAFGEAPTRLDLLDLRRPMRRGSLAAGLLALAALAHAGAVAAAPGGIGPPAPQTDSGEAISDLYWMVFAVCAVVFVAVEAALVLFIIRFRRQRGVAEDAEGPQIHGNTRLEIIWTIIPAAILAAIAIITLARIPSVEAKGGDELTIKVEAHQFYWQYDYPNGAVSFDDLRIPVDKRIRLEIVTHDVNHSWWVPALTGKKDAIAGRVNYLSFKPTRTGTWEGQCAEFCGIQHAVMYTRVTVMEESAYESWVEQQASLAGAELGKQEWGAVCAKCHGLAGEGDIGPGIAGNPAITNRQGLIQLLSQGQNTPQFESYMPPVGLGWTGPQYDALIAYIKATPELSKAPAGVQSGG